jgi:peptidoglycan hydrolase FlgJ
MEFESIFIKQMLNSMKSTIVKSDLIKEGMGEKIFDDMLYDEYAKKMSKTSDFGIGEMMYRSLSKYNS